ncbi:DUF2267 domain-containing protein [Allostreptomyces psammosilenae]|uniref:Putative pterin-4-alpha-carbinolamine dehydratase n=1 Tax=Allostreptomyces psammosilenae TaxID=1892865 RepID=A0A853ABS4_9ACTN|nr:DUF2267 domain-containing protein [Allostreptomyces psammosilenae]NYI08041.1 pterin-4a-carbinolamine dehydratase/uncharacterized protein (DUF2267 family) [Allostreptomyces psammosilenae]
MIIHEKLVHRIASRAGLPNTDAVQSVVRTVLGVLAIRLDPPLRVRLQRVLPGPERDAAWAIVPPADADVIRFLRDVADHLRVSPERALRLTQAVLSEIAEGAPEAAAELRRALPDDYAPLFQAPDPMPARSNAATNAPAVLSDADVADVLDRLTGWSGDRHRLVRSVGLPLDRVRPLLNRIERDTRDLHHPPDHEVTDDGVTFVCHTRSVDGVTELDVLTAERVDAAVEAIGSGG